MKKHTSKNRLSDVRGFISMSLMHSCSRLFLAGFISITFSVQVASAQLTGDNDGAGSSDMGDDPLGTTPPPGGGGSSGGGSGGGGSSGGGSAGSGVLAPDSRADALIGCLSDSNVNCMIDSFNGWSLDFRGYDKSPIMFNPKEANGRDRVYPELSKNKSFKTPVMGALNLGIDNEIDKMTKGAFQPVNRIANDYVSDQFKTSKSLDLFSAGRSVALLTLGYLDKTVGAGLAQIEQQMGTAVNSEMSALSSRTQYRIANPEIDRILRDTDEKIEACMTQSTSKRIAFDPDADGCPETCGTTRNYSFCVCCAQLSTTLNQNAEDGTAKDRWSLVEAIFYGTKGPEGDKANYVKNVVQDFKRMYGDVVYQVEPGTKKVKKSLLFPEISPAQKLQILRDGPKQSVSSEDGPEQLVCKPNNSANAPFLPPPTQPSGPILNTQDAVGESACNITGLSVVHGIYPALVYILKNWPVQTDEERDKIRPYWQEASLAITLTGRDIQNMLALTPYSGPKLPASWKPSDAPSLNRWLIAFADASAYAAVKRYHARNKSIAANHLLMNNTVTTQERAEFKSLMGRVEEVLTLGEYDANSNYQVEAQLNGLSIMGDRNDMSKMAGAAEGHKAAVDNVMGGMGSTFGDFTGTISAPSQATPPAAN